MLKLVLQLSRERKTFSVINFTSESSELQQSAEVRKLACILELFKHYITLHYISPLPVFTLFFESVVRALALGSVNRIFPVAWAYPDVSRDLHALAV